MSKMMTVEFHGTELQLVDKDGQPYVPMRPMVEGIGLDWKSQYRKLSANQRRWGMVMMTTPSAGGNQDASCIPLRKLAGWLSSLEPSRIKVAAVREKIELFQDECDDALWQYWNAGAAHNPRAAANDPAPQRLSVVAEDLDAAKRIAHALGLEGNQALLSAGRMVRETTGVDVLELAGMHRLINEAQEHNHTPTELGVKLGMSAVRTNQLLAEHGLQRHVEYAAGKKRWELLPAGQPFAVLTDTAKRHSDGAPVLQILWKESVLAELDRIAGRAAAIA